MKLAFPYNELKRLATFNGYIDGYGFAQDLSMHVDVDVTYVDGSVKKFRAGKCEQSTEDKDKEARLVEIARRLEAVRVAAHAEIDRQRDEAIRNVRGMVVDAFDVIRSETLDAMDKAGEWAKKQK